MNSTTPRSSLYSRVRLGLAATVLASVWLAGCSVLPSPTEDPTRFYLLQGTSPAPTTPASHGTLQIGLRPVEMPPYLANNRTIVVRSGVNEIRYQDYARWAEPLDAALQHAIRDRLLASGAVANAQTTPFSPETQRDLDITVRIHRCEGGVDANGKNTARFEASYDIIDVKHNGQVLAHREFSPPAATWDGKDYGQLAARLGDAAAGLGADIAASLPAAASRE